MAELLPRQIKTTGLNHTDHIVLLVEDDPDDVDLIMEAFAHKRSIEIIHKQNGLLALDYLKELLVKESSLPCLIILDINMPILNGKQLLSILKNEKDFDSIAVIVFTTSSNEGDRAFCKRFNVPMITKPYDMEAFNKTVQDFVEHCKAA